jgi:hypothetical protein
VLDIEGQLNEDQLMITPVDGDLAVVAAPISVESVTINSGQAQRSRIDSIAMIFSGPATLSAGDLSLHNDSTGEDFPLDQVPFDDLTNTWDISGQLLSDGRYTATLLAIGVEAYEFEFYVLRCDTDGDGEVGSGDLETLFSQFGLRGSGLAGDFNNDGRVNLTDFATLRANVGNTLPAPAPVAAPIAESTTLATTAVDQPLDDNYASDDSLATAAPGSAVYLLAELLSPGRYIPGPELISVGSPAATLQRAATAEHDLRPLSDDMASDGESDDLLADILAESSLAIPL